MRHVKAHTIDRKPLSEPVLLVLLSLSTEPRHGYALMKDVEKFSHGRVRLSTGTLYGVLRRLLADRWIERFEQADTSRDKQAYKLTREGQLRLDTELDRMRELTRAATVRLRARKV
jgi:PadR family transcriptional regulator, regulatory protein PadR